MDEYVQAWHNQIWEHGFMGWFKGKNSYSKTKAFEDHKHTDLIDKYEFILQKHIIIFYLLVNSNFLLSCHRLSHLDIS
jgi:hypothetical protein